MRPKITLGFRLYQGRPVMLYRRVRGDTLDLVDFYYVDVLETDAPCCEQGFMRLTLAAYNKLPLAVFESTGA